MPNNNSVTKILYEPDHRSTDCYVVFVNGPEYKKYIEDNSSVPLVEVVDSFEVFFSGTGATGTLGKASKQQLETVFGTSKDIDVVSKLLELGKLQKGDSISDNAYGDGNKSRGTMQQGVNGGR